MDPTVKFKDEKVVTWKEREVVIGKWSKKRNQCEGNAQRRRAAGNVR